ncbi:DUF3899 domain-containing protein [Sporosarcina limicola]|uniref:DUF3899 domain-containing protein n=1 Tax=Sporosarcina limicola TaxID=34101 RepID=A0A927R4M6_9BACL|nr:DUF3899 domain-containing protein [Sporosarcina limicola]MBE1555063.1 hypothetical protein [Sporosarcina limicola]
MKNVARNFLVAQVIITALLFLYYKEFSLLTYINSSFIVGGSLVFIGLISFIFSTGFFDIFTLSMRKVFTPKRRMEDVETMRAPSEIFSTPVFPLLASGMLILAFMGIALVIYYA